MAISKDIASFWSKVEMKDMNEWILGNITGLSF